MTKRLLVAYGCGFLLLSACGEGAPPPEPSGALPPYWVFDQNGQPANAAIGGVGNVAEEIASPSGNLAADNATLVAEEFERLGGADFSLGDLGAGATAQVSSGALTQKVVAKGADISLDGLDVCPAGGDISASQRQSGDLVIVTGRYNDCCVEVGCCISGNVTSQVSSADLESAAANGDLDIGEGFEICSSGSLQLSCGDGPESFDFDFCIGDAGVIYLIEVNGQSFAVSGSYANGSGQLTIRGANGVWECQFEGGTGSCTGDTGAFSF